jgi:hypothetical protein
MSISIDVTCPVSMAFSSNTFFHCWTTSAVSCSGVVSRVMKMLVALLKSATRSAPNAAGAVLGSIEGDTLGTLEGRTLGYFEGTLEGDRDGLRESRSFRFDGDSVG